jgi:hypothetical protein
MEKSSKKRFCTKGVEEDAGEQAIPTSLLPASKVCVGGRLVKKIEATLVAFRIKSLYNICCRRTRIRRMMRMRIKKTS